MSSCFSPATILRCPSLTQIEYILVSVPVALEVLFSFLLVYLKWGTGRKHLWLALEGWVYCVLAGLELISHIVPAARDNLFVFEAIDIALAAASFLPVFFYALFLFLYMRDGVLHSLPKRLAPIMKWTLLIFIPVMVAINTLSSFFGITRRLLPRAGDRALQLMIGYTSAENRTISMFLTSLMLVLLTAYQAINFSLAFYRLIRTFVDQRRIETSHTDEAHLANGIGYISAGLKLGAIETVIGFVTGGFYTVLMRRILRLVSRVFLIVGVIKGIDSEEDFAHLDEELRGHRDNKRRSKMRSAFISNPRFSTFRKIESLADLSDTEKPQTIIGLGRRVTISRKNANSAPTLDLRFSALEVPIPDTPTPSTYTVQPWTTASSTASSHARASTNKSNPLSLHDGESSHYSNETISAPQPTFQAQHQREESNGSSIAAVRALASQFPGLPPRVSPRTRSTLSGSAPGPQLQLSTQSQAGGASGLTPRESMKRRKPAPSPLERVVENPFVDASPRQPVVESVSGWIASTRTSLSSETYTYTYRQSNASQQGRVDMHWLPQDHPLSSDEEHGGERLREATTTTNGSALARIKSVGHVRGQRKTPTPTHTAFSRGSVSVVKILNGSSAESTGAEAETGTLSDASSRSSEYDERPYRARNGSVKFKARADSSILGESEDPRFMAVAL